MRRRDLLVSLASVPAALAVPLSFRGADEPTGAALAATFQTAGACVWRLHTLVKTGEEGGVFVWSFRCDGCGAACPGIADAMGRANLPEDLVTGGFAVAEADKGVFELGELWLEEEDEGERAELVAAIRDVVGAAG